MPEHRITTLYEYRCNDCDRRLFLGDDDEESPIVCPFCASPNIMFVKTRDVTL